MYSTPVHESIEDLEVVKQAVEHVRSQARSEIGPNAEMTDAELESKIDKLNQRAEQLEKVSYLSTEISSQYSVDEIIKRSEDKLRPGDAIVIREALEVAGRFSNGLGSVESPIPGLTRPDYFTGTYASFPNISDYRNFYIGRKFGSSDNQEEIIRPLLSPIVAAQTFHPALIPTRAYRKITPLSDCDFRKTPEVILGSCAMAASLFTYFQSLPVNLFAAPLPQCALYLGVAVLVARVGMSIGHFLGTLIRAPLIALQRKQQQRENHPEHVLRSLVKKAVSSGGNLVDLREPLKTLGNEFKKEADSLRADAQALVKYREKLILERNRAIVGVEVNNTVSDENLIVDLNASLVDRIADETRAARISRLTREAFKIVANISKTNMKKEIEMALEILDAKPARPLISLHNMQLANWVADTLRNYRDNPLQSSIKSEVKGVLEIIQSDFMMNESEAGAQANS